MGTPLYMSPEQCGGGHVDMRSDIYSLGVIAYQMLAGDPPFSGNTSTVMRAHREQSPQDIRERAKKIPKRVAGVVMSALSKNPAERPATAFAFGSSLRGQSEGVGALYRRAFSLYSEYFPKFLKLSLIAHIPVFVTTFLMSLLFVADHYWHRGSRAVQIALVCAMAIVGLAHIIAYMVSSAVISGVTGIIVTQLTAAPLRPVELRVAFAVLRKRWRAFLRTVVRVTLRIFLGTLLLIIPGIIIWIRYSRARACVAFVAHDHHCLDTSDRDSDGRQFLCRTNQDRSQPAACVAGNEGLSAGVGTGKHLHRAADLDRARVAVS
jgi:hypothetical protein